VARGCSGGTAAALVFVLALALLALLGLLLIPPLVDQVTTFANALPDIISSANQGHGPLGSLERRFHLLDHVSETVSGRGEGVGGVATSGLGVVLGLLGTAAAW
jgi:predicted PurR-regulated permease PerM